MKKVYFISPHEKSLTVYYREVRNNYDVSKATSINIGYNDSYEMRSQHLPKPYFSDDLEDLLKILRERKRKMIEKAYQKLYQVGTLELPTEEDARLHDSIDSPF